MKISGLLGDRISVVFCFSKANLWTSYVIIYGITMRKRWITRRPPISVTIYGHFSGQKLDTKEGLHEVS
jgi:hypothetical protein